MDWSFTEEQDQLAALTRQILEENLSEERMREIEAREDRFDEQLWKLLKDAGILDVRSYDLVGWCRVLIEVGRTRDRRSSRRERRQDDRRRRDDSRRVP
jgi:hypothetical protein